jgi:formylmethanofuran dehydrogenase subunit E
MDKIRSYTFEEYCDRVKKFHGALAPGVIIGGYMVDLACRNIPEGTLFDAICETSACLPDAIQLLTPCTVGNQWLKVINVGRYAASFYNKYTGDGVRVYLDHNKMDRYPAIREWLLKLKPKKEQDYSLLLNMAGEAGTSICGLESIQVSSKYLKKKKQPIVICRVCHESFRSDDSDICPACKDGCLPYQIQPK